MCFSSFSFRLRGKFICAIVLLPLLLFSAAAAQDNSITVSGSPQKGILPWMITAFANQSGTDVLPLGPTDYYIFTLFDTGATRVFFDPVMGDFFGLSDRTILDIRINGMGVIDPATLLAPIYPGSDPPQAEVQDIPISRPAIPPDLTLIGGPVTNAVKAVIDYAVTVLRGPYGYIDPPYVEGPDIVFYPVGTSVGYTPAIVLSLQAFGTNPDGDPGLGQRYYVHNLSFNQGAASLASPPPGTDLGTTSTRFLYDTGSAVTLIRSELALSLGLTTGVRDFTYLDPSNGVELDGFYVDSITMAGAGGTYTVLGAPVIVTPDPLGGSADAIIGSNLFSQVKLLFDGPNATLGIGVAGGGAPVANAGADQLIEATGPTTSFTLDGLGSSDPDGASLTYDWKDEWGIVVGSEATVTLSRGLGTYVFRLTVTDAEGLTAEDTVSITVRDTTPPVLTAPPDITVPESNPAGTAVYLGEPTVSDICDTHIVAIHDAPALFPLGETIVTWTATDDSGNTATAQQKVTVVALTPYDQLRALDKFIKNSLISKDIAWDLQWTLLGKVSIAMRMVTSGHPDSIAIAIKALRDLVTIVEAQAGVKITPSVAAEIIARANRITADLGG